MIIHSLLVDRMSTNKSYKLPFFLTQSQITECKGNIIRLCSQLKQREKEVERANEIAPHLTRERDSVSEVVRQEFADRSVENL